jgi:hypothetical protein
MKRLDDVARDLVGLFEAQGVPYALMGGLAVRMHALPRPTFDVDFTVLLPRAELPRFYDLFESLGYTVPAVQRTGWIDTVRELPVVKVQFFVADRAIDVDIFLAERPFQHQIIARRQRHQMDGLDAWVVSPEDLVLLKLLAGRPKDLVDVADIMFVQGRLDEEYLRHWASQLGVSEALDEALRRRLGSE